MKRQMRRLIAVLMTVGVLLCVGVLTADASSADKILEEQFAASGAASLYELLPSETKALLSTLGIDELSFEAMTSLEPQTVLSSLKDMVLAQSASPWSTVLWLIGTLLILGFVAIVQPADSDHGVLFQTVCMLTAITPLLVPLWQLLERVQAVSDSAAAFSLGFTPIYAGIVAASGRAATAVSYQTVMLAAAQGLSLLCSAAVVPLLSISLSLGIAGAVDPIHRLGDIGNFVNKAAVWILTGMLTIFVGLLSLQSVLLSAADSVGGRMLRFSVSGFVPIVGGALSEVLYTVRGCLGMLKGTVGGIGILCTALIVLPTLVECVIWNVLLTAAKMTADLFSLLQIAAVVDMIKSIVRVLIAVLSSCALLMIISVTVVSLSGGGVQ